MMKSMSLKITICALLLAFSSNAFTQIPDSNRYEISVLTYSTGDQLYSLYGHSSFMVKDRVANTAMIYNYGLFDFSEQNFYYKFVKGQLPYVLGKSPANRVLHYEQQIDRHIVEQVLNLSPNQETLMVDLLEDNYLPENRVYNYDFLYDNCATKLYMMIDSVVDGDLEPSIPEYKGTTFRKLVMPYFDIKPWARLGVNILMAFEVDKKASTAQSTYLPDYLYQVLKHSSYGQGKAIVEEERIILNNQQNFKPPFLSPLLVIGALLVCYLFFYFKPPQTKRLEKVLDWAAFIPATAIGLLLIALWAGTSQYIFKWNVDLFWANPLYLLLISRNVRLRLWIRRILSVGLVASAIYHAFYTSEFALILFFMILWSRIWKR